MLKMVFQIRKRNDDAATDVDTELYTKDEVAFVNNFISSAFSTIQCSLNGRLVYYFLFPLFT